MAVIIITLLRKTDFPSECVNLQKVKGYTQDRVYVKEKRGATTHIKIKILESTF
jgi:hypothetical protein